MIEQIQEVRAQGFKPAIYIDHTLIKLLCTTYKLTELYDKAKDLNIPIYGEGDTPVLNRIRKAFIFRYGSIPVSTEAMIIRKGGKIISGNLQL